MGVGVIMGAREIVKLMTELVPDGGAALERRDGLHALAVAQEMEGALMSAMERKLGYVLLWEQFLTTPDEVALALTGVVQALMEADPVLAEWLEAALARYEQAAAG
jgi:hypothetical protein